MDKKRKAYMLTIDDYLVICEMAMKNGKKAGDNMQAEFDEYVKTHPQVSCLGEYEDKDLLKGDM